MAYGFAPTVVCCLTSLLVSCRMHKYLHVLTDMERIRDPGGQEFENLAQAIAEATQSARDLMADELRAGRPLPLGWKVQVAEADETIVATVSFAEIALGTTLPARPRPVLDPHLHQRAREVFHKVRTERQHLVSGLHQLREHVRALSQLNGSLPKG